MNFLLGGHLIKHKKNLPFILFVLSTIFVLGSITESFATHEGTQGTLGNGDLEACLNNVGPAPCDTTAEWNGQNLTHEVNYILGESIPIKIDITNLETDVDYHGLIIDWDLAKTQGQVVNHTFDYITSIDRNDNPHPCMILDPTERCFGFGSDHFPIPPPTVYTDIDTVDGSMQPSDSFNSITDPNQKLFYMFAEGGTVEILHIDYLSEGDPTIDSATQL